MKRPHIVARFGGAMHLNAIQVGKALQNLGFEQHRTRDGRFWIVKERPVTDIGKFLPNMEDLSENTDNQQDSSHSPPF